MSYISYDVVKIILEIKYQNWVNEKSCVCGNEDFRNCIYTRCGICGVTHCTDQPGYSSWVWHCNFCVEFFCGAHRFSLDPFGKKVCIECSCFRRANNCYVQPIDPKKVTEYFDYVDYRNHKYDAYGELIEPPE
jgi:hypothetical protein